MSQMVYGRPDWLMMSSCADLKSLNDSKLNFLMIQFLAKTKPDDVNMKAVISMTWSHMNFDLLFGKTR